MQFNLRSFNSRLVLLFFLFARSFSDDLVINSTVSAIWTSLTFIIPHETPREYPWLACKRHSRYYCLYAFETNGRNSDPAYEASFNALSGSHEELVHFLHWVDNFAIDASNDLFKPVYKKLNHYVDLQDGCCFSQYYQYFIYGYTNMLLTTKEYLAKLADYSESSKNLNEIQSYYLPSCRVNIITKLGFGQGTLRRTHHRTGVIRPKKGYNYIIKTGLTWSARIPYENPEYFITFPWFKNNIMCRERPWICENQQ